MTVRLGLLYPGHAAEDDYDRAAAFLGDEVELCVVHTSVGTDAHRFDALVDLGSSARLLEGARRLAPWRPDAVVWACTSGSFVFGTAGARRQAAELGEALGVPASSTSFAFVHAARDLGLTQVAVAATYPGDVAGSFAAFLAESGIEVVGTGAEDILTAAEVGTVGQERALAFVAGADRPGAQAVLVPDTALHSIAWLEEAEAALGKPVLSANQVTLWEGLRLAGPVPAAPGLGQLFASGPMS